VRGDEASDHLPVLAEFGIGVPIKKPSENEESVEAH
jgi:hypothetical protein